jgi:hypothetical protein
MRSSTRWVSGVEQRLARGHGADGLDQVGATHLLEQVAGRTGHDRLEQRLVVGVGGEHQAGDLGVLRAHLAAHLHAVAVGQTDVEHRHLRAGWPGCG